MVKGHHNNKFKSLLSGIECDPLDKPDNGDVIIESTLFQAIATYTCNPGYELIGTAQRICGGEGVWTGVAPTCRRK